MSWNPHDLSFLQIATGDNLSRLRRLLARHDSLDQLRTELESGTEALTWLRGESVATLRAALVDASLYARALRETEIARQKGARLLRRGDEGFPETLARAVKPPELVWLWGHTPPTGEMIAIVGAHVGAGLRARAVSIAWRGVLFNALMIGAVGLLFAIQPGWWCDTLASTSADSRWVRAWDFRPLNPRVVHHAILNVDRTGWARRAAAADQTHRDRYR